MAKNTTMKKLDELLEDEDNLVFDTEESAEKVTEAVNKVSNVLKEEEKVKNAARTAATLTATYKGEKLIPVTLSPFYAPYLSKRARISLNGISVYVPCDGSIYNIPESFAAELHRKVKSIDKQVQKMASMSKVDTNYERSPGELQF